MWLRLTFVCTQILFTYTDLAPAANYTVTVTGTDFKSVTIPRPVHAFEGAVLNVVVVDADLNTNDATVQVCFACVCCVWLNVTAVSAFEHLMCIVHSAHAILSRFDWRRHTEQLRRICNTCTSVHI